MAELAFGTKHRAAELELEETSMYGHTKYEDFAHHVAELGTLFKRNT